MPPFFLFLSSWGGFFWFVSALLVTAVHECAHAMTAYALGDQTPRRDGRVTLSPFPHIDPLGFFLILFFGFGWAKPVRFDPSQLRFRTFGSTFVALAGPLSNGALLILAIVLSRFFLPLFSGTIARGAYVFFASIIILSATLGVANLIPVPPFDGSKIVLDWLRFLHFERAVSLLEEAGPYLLIALILLDSFAGTKLLSRGIAAIVTWALPPFP